MEMMHATQNEEQLCPNPNLKCTREWSGLGLADQNWHLCWTADSAWELSWVECERKTQLLLTQAFVAGCGGDGGGEWGTSFSKKVLQKGPGQRKMPTSCVFALCKDMFSKKLVYKTLSSLKCSPLPWVGLELQFLELINVSTEVIIILFLCKSLKFYMPGMVICPPNTFFFPIGRDMKGL